MKKVIYLLLLVILPGLSAQAQTVYKDQVRVENQSITRVTTIALRLLWISSCRQT